MTSLAAVPALRGLAAAELAALARDGRPAEFRAGAVIRPAGERARAVVLLLSGTVVAVSDGPSGGEVWADRWEGPAIADKPAVLDGGEPSTRLVALTRVTALLVPRERFLRLLDEQRSVRDFVLGRLARDVTAGQQRLAAAVTLPAVARVAAWLRARDPVDRVAWRGSQEQLARMLGLSRVTVNRALARLAGAGAVRLTARGVLIEDRERLDAAVWGGG